MVAVLDRLGRDAVCIQRRWGETARVLWETQGGELKRPKEHILPNTDGGDKADYISFRQEMG